MLGSTPCARSSSRIRSAAAKSRARFASIQESNRWLAGCGIACVFVFCAVVSTWLTEDSAGEV
eukprot:7180908-Prymnesium_polylepis.1